MIRLERTYGWWTGRVWGLILNFVANAVALYGVAGVIRDGSRLSLLVIGIIVSGVCVAVLALPNTADRR